MQLTRVPFSVARIATGVWFVLYALTALLAVPNGLLQGVAAVASLAWLVEAIYPAGEADFEPKEYIYCGFGY